MGWGILRLGAKNRSVAEEIRQVIEEDEEQRSILENIVSCVEKKYEREKDEFPTLSDKFEWHDVGIMPQKLMKLVFRGILIIRYKSRSSTYYQVADFDLTKKVLRESEVVNEDIRVEKKEFIMPSDLFDVIIGFNDVKNVFQRSIESPQVNILLCGPPASAKSLFLMEIERLENSYACFGGRSRKAGIEESIHENLSTEQKAFLVIDEFEKMDKADYTVLLGLGEGGRLKTDVHGKHIDQQYDIRLYGACNTTRGIPDEVLSRFWVFNIPEYTKEDFLAIVEQVLIKRERIDKELSAYIAQKIAPISFDVRDAVRIARLAKSVDDVDYLLNVMKKFNKNRREEL